MQKVSRLHAALRPGCFRTFMLLAAITIFVGLNTASAQSLNWEGQTGVFVTPLAYTLPAKDNALGRPVVAYHYLDAGQVLGGFHQVSISLGAFGRAEFGYTRDIHQDGSTAGLSSLWSGGFNAFHGKVNIVQESRTWLPALSVGFVARLGRSQCWGRNSGQEHI